MADQQPGDVPAAGPSPAAEPTAAQPTAAQPAAAASPPTRIEAGDATPPEDIGVTADVPARWSGSAAVPPPVPKRSWLARRRAVPEPDDRVAMPAVDPWADQDTPWDELLPPVEPMPPTRLDRADPLPPTRLDRADPLPPHPPRPGRPDAPHPPRPAGPGADRLTGAGGSARRIRRPAGRSRRGAGADRAAAPPWLGPQAPAAALAAAGQPPARGPPRTPRPATRVPRRPAGAPRPAVRVPRRPAPGDPP
jgi:hypothetical protein